MSEKNRNKLTKYKQIIEYYQNQIVSNQLMPKQKLSSIREIAKKFKVCSSTAQKAYKFLVQSNICYVEHGHGTYVCKGAREIIVKNIQANFEFSVLKLKNTGMTDVEIINIIKKKSNNY